VNGLISGILKIGIALMVGGIILFLIGASYISSHNLSPLELSGYGLVPDPMLLLTAMGGILFVVGLIFTIVGALSKPEEKIYPSQKEVIIIIVGAVLFLMGYAVSIGAIIIAGVVLIILGAGLFLNSIRRKKAINT
jgi:hypothetical protein